MPNKFETYAIHVLALISTLGTWIFERLEILGTSPVLPACVGILALVGSFERWRRDRAARKLLEKKLSRMDF